MCAAEEVVVAAALPPLRSPRDSVMTESCIHSEFLEVLIAAAASQLHSLERPPRKGAVAALFSARLQASLAKGAARRRRTPPSPETKQARAALQASGAEEARKDTVVDLENARRLAAARAARAKRLAAEKQLAAAQPADAVRRQLDANKAFGMAGRAMARSYVPRNRPLPPWVDALSDEEPPATSEQDAQSATQRSEKWTAGSPAQASQLSLDYASDASDQEENEWDAASESGSDARDEEHEMDASVADEQADDVQSVDEVKSRRQYRRRSVAVNTDASILELQCAQPELPEEALHLAVAAEAAAALSCVQDAATWTEPPDGPAPDEPEQTRAPVAMYTLDTCLTLMRRLRLQRRCRQHLLELPSVEAPAPDADEAPCDTELPEAERGAPLPQPSKIDAADVEEVVGPEAEAAITIDSATSADDVQHFAELSQPSFDAAAVVQFVHFCLHHAAPHFQAGGTSVPDTVLLCARPGDRETLQAVLDALNEALHLRPLGASPLSQQLWRSQLRRLHDADCFAAVHKQLTNQLLRWLACASANSSEQRLDMQHACDLEADERRWNATVERIYADLLEKATRNEFADDDADDAASPCKLMQ